MEGIKIIQGNIIDLEPMCGVACYSEDMLGHLQLGLDNLVVDNLIMLRNSRLSLTVEGMSLLLEGLSEPWSSISVLQG